MIHRPAAGAALALLVSVASSSPGPAVAAPEVVIQRGLRFGPQHLALSADGSRVAASGGFDRHVLLFETATGRELRRLPFDAEVRGVALEDDGRALWAAVGDQLVRIDLARGERVSSGSVFGPLGDLARRPAGDVLAAVRGTHVLLFDGRTAKRLTELLLPPAAAAKLSLRFSAVAFSADGAWLATSTLRDGARPAWVGVWHAGTYALAAHVVLDQGDAVGVSALVGGGAVFATSTGEVRRWRGGKAPAEVVGRHETPISSVCADPTGRDIVSGAGRWTGREYVDSDLHHSRPDGGGDVRRYPVPGIPPDDCVFSADGKHVLAGAGLYVTASGRRVRELGLHGELAGHGADFDPPRGAMVVSAHGRTIAWDLAEARQRYQLESCERSRVYPAIDRLVVKVCRDGGYSNVIAIHRLSDGRLVREVTVDRERRNTLAFDLSPDGARLATLTHGFGLRLFDAATGRVVKETPLGSDPRAAPRTLTFTPDGATLAVAAADTSVTLYAARDGAERARHAKVITATSLTSTPDGKKLVLGGNGAATLDLASGRVDFLPVRGLVESLAWSSDGRTLAFGAGANAGTVQLYTLATGALSAPFPVHSNSSVLSIAFHPNGKLVMTAAFSGEVSLLSLEGLKRIADLAFLGDDGYVAYTPDRLYTATPRAHRHIHFVDGDRVIPFESFDLTFNRPDLVLERIGLADPAVLRLYRAAWERRVRRAGFTPEKLGRGTEVPHVELAGAAPPFEVATPSVQLSLRARDPRRALARLHVRVNGVDLHGSGGAPVTASAGALLERTVTVTLTPGRNVIRASVLNDEGLESPAVCVEVDFTGAAAPPTLHVVSVGVSDYLGDDWDLTYAAKDARDLAAHFGRPGAPYGRVVAHTVLDGEVTRERLLATKEALMQTRVEDRVVLFVAGHGLLDDQLRYWFATADVDFSAPSARGLDYDLLEGLLDGIPARHKLLLIDTCHAGEVDTDAALAVASSAGAAGAVRERAVRGLRNRAAPRAPGGRTSFQLLGELFTDLQRRSGAVVIASAAGTELALESAEWKNGVFTFAVLEALRASPHLPMSELHSRVSARVVELTAGRQRPTARQQNRDLDFSL